jgi:hypothetical protein
MVPISKATSKSSGGRYPGVCHSKQLAGSLYLIPIFGIVVRVAPAW